MFYLSDFQGSKVVDRKGAVVGSISDMIIKANSPSGAVVKAVVSRGRKTAPVVVPWHQVAACDEAVILSVDRESLATYVPDPDDVPLCKAILDKQIIDVKGIRVVRVNDVALSRTDHAVKVAGVDTGLRGLLRRLGLLRVAEVTGKLFGWAVPERLVPWNCVEPLSSAISPITLSVPWSKVVKLHPADLADIVDDLDLHERRSLFNVLDDEVAAQTLAEVEEPKIQESILDTLGRERASDILEEMPPDDAADILGDLPPHKATSLLDAMEDEEAEEVKSLLSYRDDTAGGLMTTELVKVPLDFTVEQTIRYLRELKPDADTVYYLYVVDAADRLIGVLPLRDLIVSEPDVTVERLTVRPAVSATVDMHADEVVELMAKYDYLALPVVDHQGVLKGSITVDDVMELALESKR
ncbi:MAG: CBS domain-containing protein [Firmicutes bacterium]|nr:CBS domain-containing protein [Bacillota bacterium]